MATVDEINSTFAEKGLGIELPLPGNWLVANIDILEKRSYPTGVRVLLGVRYVDDKGKEINDLFLCEGRVSRPAKAAAIKNRRIQDSIKTTLLPTRETVTFADEDEARDYLREAIGHLLQDKGYSQGDQGEVDIYFSKGDQGFFINIAACCDEMGLEKAKELITLRRKHGAMHDYGLVIPAFQESLGVPLRVQERWVASNVEYLSAYRIGIYAVNNQDPNRIYAFTIYPKSKELMRYFVTTAPQWSLVRDRYVASRQKR